jgi:tetratricopeptide (TPR) repeat protein
LVERGEHARAAVLTGVEEVIEACLEREVSRRPTAEAVQRRMGELAELAGGRRMQILTYEHTPEHEAAFWDCLAGTYGSLGQHEEYLRLMKRVAHMRPEDPLAWLNLGHAFFRLQRYEEALEASFEAESRIGAERIQWRIQLYNHQGNVLDEMGRHAEAISIFQRALELDSLNASTWQNMAITCWKWAHQAETGERITRLLQGLRATEQALRIEPSRQNSLQLRQMILEALGQLEERRES